MKSWPDRWLAPWVFVLTGIVFNILAAVITHYFIGLNNDRINLIDSAAERKQVLIDSLWQSRIEVERKEEFFILLLATPAQDPAAVAGIYRSYLLELVDLHGLQQFAARLAEDDGSTADLLLEISDAAQASIMQPWPPHAAGR